MNKIIFFLIYFCFYSFLFANENENLSNKLNEIIKDNNLTNEQKITQIKDISIKAIQLKKEKILLIAADFIINFNKEKALNLYRELAKISLQKKNYNTLFAAGKNIAYLSNYDEGEMYFYWSARLAMNNSDWFFILNVCKRLIEINRFESADKWLERAGYFARRRKAINGLYKISFLYKKMGYNYQEKVLYYYTVAKKIEKELSGIQY